MGIKGVIALVLVSGIILTGIRLVKCYMADMKKFLGGNEDDE